MLATVCVKVGQSPSVSYGFLDCHLLSVAATTSFVHDFSKWQSHDLIEAVRNKGFVFNSYDF